MCQSLSVPPCVIGLLVTLAMGLMSFTGGGKIEAQEFPPFPTLYGGHVWINSEPAQIGTVLVARVGDYHTNTVVDEEGRYRNLLVQPPSSDYYGLPITFHAFEATAQESETFLKSGAPEFKTAFDLHFPISETKPSLAPSPQATPTLTKPSPAPSAQATPTLVVVPAGASDERLVLVIALLVVVGVVVTVGVFVALGRR